MITLKSDAEIKKMREAGKVAARILKKIREKSIPGVSTLDLNKIAEDEIRVAKMDIGFRTVEDYQFAICTTPNEAVVHGLPSDYKIQVGDVLGIDLGVMNQGLHTDTAITYEVRPKGENKPISKENDLFLKTGSETLKKAIALVKDGVRVGDISAEIQKGVESAGYNVVKELTGHGVGYELHEDPFIPGFGKKGTGPILTEGMTVAIEVIYTKGKSKVGILEDGWTIVTADQSIAGVFEHTVQVTKSGPVVLTQE